MEERRRSDTEIEQLKIEFASFTSTVKEWMNGTAQYRLDLCKKQDRLLNKQEEFAKILSNLPCKERSLGTKLVWGAIGVLGTLLFIHLGWK